MIRNYLVVLSSHFCRYLEWFRVVVVVVGAEWWIKISIWSFYLTSSFCVFLSSNIYHCCIILVKGPVLFGENWHCRYADIMAMVLFYLFLMAMKDQQSSSWESLPEDLIPEFKGCRVKKWGSTWFVKTLLG